MMLRAVLMFPSFCASAERTGLPDMRTFRTTVVETPISSGASSRPLSSRDSRAFSLSRQSLAAFAAELSTGIDGSVAVWAHGGSGYIRRGLRLWSRHRPTAVATKRRPSGDVGIAIGTVHARLLGAGMPRQFTSLASFRWT